MGLDKEYDFVSIFGFATDTYDILGKIVRMEKLENLLENDIRKVADNLKEIRENRLTEEINEEDLMHAAFGNI